MTNRENDVTHRPTGVEGRVISTDKANGTMIVELETGPTVETTACEWHQL